MPIHASTSALSTSSLFHPAILPAAMVAQQGDSHMEALYKANPEQHRKLLSQIVSHYLTPFQIRFQKAMQALLRDQRGVFNPQMIATAWKTAKMPSDKEQLSTVDIYFIAADTIELHHYLEEMIDAYITQIKTPPHKKETLHKDILSIINDIAKQRDKHEFDPSVLHINLFIMEHLTLKIINVLNEKKAIEKVKSIGFPEILSDPIMQQLYQLYQLRQVGSCLAFEWLSALFCAALRTEKTNLPALHVAFEAHYLESHALEQFGTFARCRRIIFLTEYLCAAITKLINAEEVIPFNEAISQTYKIKETKVILDQEITAVTDPSLRWSRVRSKEFLNELYAGYIDGLSTQLAAAYNIAYPPLDVLDVQPNYLMCSGG